MDVWCPHRAGIHDAPIGARLDCLKMITTLFVSELNAVTLKVWIQRSVTWIARMIVSSAIVCLPHLNSRAAHWLTVEIYHATDQVNQQPFRAPKSSFDKRQISISVK